VADQVTAWARRPMVCRSPEANSRGNGESAETAGHQEKGETVCENLAGCLVASPISLQDILQPYGMRSIARRLSIAVVIYQRAVQAFRYSANRTSVYGEH
jgi:hypothetical protein